MDRSTSRRRLKSTRERILIVDDEPLVARAIAAVLDEYDTTHAFDAVHALELLGAGTEFDVVLCDLGLPGMSGIDLHAVVCRHMPELSQRFLFMTGGSLTPEANAFIRAHHDRVIDKPFDAAHLRDMIATRLTGVDRARVRETAATSLRRP